MLCKAFVNLRPLLFIASIASLTNCMTMSMSAKNDANQDDISMKSAGMCSHYQNSRSECDDQAGCAWDIGQGRCNAQ